MTQNATVIVASQIWVGRSQQRKRDGRRNMCTPREGRYLLPIIQGNLFELCVQHIYLFFLKDLNEEPDRRYFCTIGEYEFALHSNTITEIYFSYPNHRSSYTLCYSRNDGKFYVSMNTISPYVHICIYIYICICVCAYIFISICVNRDMYIQFMYIIVNSI